MNITSDYNNKLNSLIKVLLGKMTVDQLSMKLIFLHGTRRLITLFTRAHHCTIAKPDECNPYFHNLFPHDPF
jgi:hypothetical protein